MNRRHLAALQKRVKRESPTKTPTGINCEEVAGRRGQGPKLRKKKAKKKGLPG